MFPNSLPSTAPSRGVGFCSSMLSTKSKMDLRVNFFDEESHQEQRSVLTKKNKKENNMNSSLHNKPIHPYLAVSIS